MALYKINNSGVTKLVARDLSLERSLQELFEENLEEILDIIFLYHEYSTSFGGRIDTLGIDKHGSPCIIEYKRTKCDNVINQGLSYLRWLLDHKGDFKILCKNKDIMIEIDWDSPRVICIAENFNKYDLDTADILPINVELLRYRVYDGSILYVEPDNYQKVRISKSGMVKKANRLKAQTGRLQKTYSIDDHMSGIDRQIINLFQTLREMILSLDEDIIEEAKAKYIAYKTSTNFTDVVVKQYGLKIFLNVKSGQLNDPLCLARDLTKPKIIGHWGNGDYEVKIEKESELESVFALIKQSYDLNK